jgi:hypothetical protein
MFLDVVSGAFRLVRRGDLEYQGVLGGGWPLDRCGLVA